VSRLGGARADWEERIGRRSETGEAARERRLPPPEALRAFSGAGQVTLSWEPVEGAIGYVLHRAHTPDGPWEKVDHGGMDVLAHPGPRYADTTGKRLMECYYAIASVAAEEDDPGELSAPVRAKPLGEMAEPIAARVDATGSAGRHERVWRMIGSERLSQLFCPQDSPTGFGAEGGTIGDEFAEALRMAQEELGATYVRAHAILHDDLQVWRGEGEFDFTNVDRVYDRVLDLGLRPVVELSFMPRGLAADPSATVFEYGAGISVPSDWDAWEELVGALTAHLVERYGIEEVRRWGFEVWNEANLEVFWTGSMIEYFRLYESAVRAVKAVDPQLPVGGPATAAAGWVPDFLDFILESGAPLDFFTTHTYGNLPLDVGEALRVRGLDDVEVWWTEWGVIPTHFAPVNDSVLSATFALHGMKSAQGRADYLAYWVVSDHFEELGRGPAMLHGGFGLLTVGNLRKPRWYALALAESLGDDLLPLTLEGDGAGSLVDGWAARGDDGRVDVLLWNGTLDHGKVSGDRLLDREISLVLDGLGDGPWTATLARVDLQHSNVSARWAAEAPWPTEEQLAELRAGDVLFEEELGELDGGRVDLTLPMPGIVRLRLRPA
jgi:xylan 1,4-beta-xylosidase